MDHQFDGAHDAITHLYTTRSVDCGDLGAYAFRHGANAGDRAGEGCRDTYANGLFGDAGVGRLRCGSGQAKYGRSEA
ncbi:hypothetical protein LP416_23625 [Polaromonas sp. P2-4]|nr:hypothetical protein LP416_23625 [Polaromonas sp. P2-4]